MSGSVEETQALGERIGQALQPGDVVALYGELGSGKTTLVQGIVRGAGRDPAMVKSPTFVLMREYPPGPSDAGSARSGSGEGPAGGPGGDVPVTHLDGYRLDGAPAAAWLDAELMFSPQKITLIEWAERFAGLLPEDHLEVQLKHVSANRRRIAVVPHGARGTALMAQLEQPAVSPTEGSDESPGH